MWNLVDSAQVGRIASLDTLGAPHVAPVCYVLDGVERLYWIVDNKPKASRDLKRLKNIRSNPRVAMLVDYYTEDWLTLWWIRVDGSARIVTDDAEHLRAVDLLSRKYWQYAGDPPSGPSIAIDIQRWRSWRASSSGSASRWAF